MIRLALLLLCLGGPAFGGAWPRAKGTHFQNIVLRYDMPRGSEGGFLRLNIFHEAGVSDKLTFAFDLSHSLSGYERAMAFLIRDLPFGPDGFSTTWSLGVGIVGGEPAGRVGAAIGHGITRGDWSIWFSGEGAVEALRNGGGIAAKFDATIGAAAPQGIKYYLQAFSGYSGRNGPELRIGGAAALPLKDGLYLDVGASRELVADRRTRFKLGIWREF